MEVETENVVCITCRKKVLRKCWDSARCSIRRWTLSSRDCPNSRRASRRARNSWRRTRHHSTSRAKRWPAAIPRVLAEFHCYPSLLRLSPNSSCRSWTIRACVYVFVFTAVTFSVERMCCRSIYVCTCSGISVRNCMHMRSRHFQPYLAYRGCW